MFFLRKTFIIDMASHFFIKLFDRKAYQNYSLFVINYSLICKANHPISLLISLYKPRNISPPSSIHPVTVM